jgi:hypothetical protein
MRRRTLIALGLLTPFVARANPYILNPSSFLAFCTVAFWALVVESGIVALLLTVSGLATFRAFLALLVLNLAVFIFGFWPLVDEHRLPIAVLELLVVAVDGTSIKLVASFEFFQGNGFRGVSWRRAGVISLIGNAASFFVGVIASGAPWRIHDYP